MWNGAFTLNKSIGTVKFIPLLKMTRRDWDWLDFANIRTVAQNRIAKIVIAGNLIGFFQVNIVEKAAKNEYLYPATTVDLVEFTENQVPSGFGHVKDEDTLVREFADLTGMTMRLELLPDWVKWLLLLGMKDFIEKYESDEQKREQAKEIREEMIAEFNAEHIAFILASIMLWEMTLEESEKLLDDLPESDEADEVRDWINDQLAGIAASRRSLAAARNIRGLSKHE